MTNRFVFCPLLRVSGRLPVLLVALACLLATVLGQEVGTPTLLTVLPQRGATQVDPTQLVTFSFSTPMQRQQAVLWFAGSSPIDTNRVVYSWSPDSKALSASLPGGWPGDREIQWILLPSVAAVPPFFDGIAGFEDVDGNPLEGEAEGSFQTKAGGSTGPVIVVVTNSCGQVFTNVVKSSFSLNVSVLHLQNGPDTVVLKPGTGDDAPCRFTALVMLEGSAKATQGKLRLPSGEIRPLTSSPMLPLFFLSETAQSLEALSTRFPMGSYQLSLEGASGVPGLVHVTLPGDSIPTIRLVNYTAAQSVDAAQDFVLTWAPIGATAQDGLKVQLRDSAGKVVVSSPDPGCPGALDGTSTSFKIPVGTLKAEAVYAGEIALALRDAGTEIDATTRSLSLRWTSTEFPLGTYSDGLPPVAPVVLKALAIDNGSLVMGCTAAEAGRIYRLESADSVLGPWSFVAEKVASGSQMQFEVALTPSDWRFFRVVGR